MRFNMSRTGSYYRKFKDKNVRLTTARKIILDIFRKTPRHLSADEVFLLAQKNYPGIGLATVYRTLSLLTRLGIIHKLNFGEGRNRYELSTKSKGVYHYHLICIHCGKITDCFDPEKKQKEFIKDIEKGLLKRHKFKVNSREIYFYGLCKRCH